MLCDNSLQWLSLLPVGLSKSVPPTLKDVTAMLKAVAVKRGKGR